MTAEHRAPERRTSWTAIVAGVFAALALAGELVQYVRGDFDRAGGLLLLLAIAATAGACFAAVRTAPPRRAVLLGSAAAAMWGLGLVGVFTAMFLLLPGAPFATAGAVRAAATAFGAARAGLLAGGIAAGAAALVALVIAVS